MLENASQNLEYCRYCLMCRHVAPVGIVSYNETLTPHGVALVAESVKRGLVEWNRESVDVIFSEVDGGNSRMHCVNHVPFEDAVAAVRAQLTEQQLAPAIVYQLEEQMRAWASPYAQMSAVEDQQGDVAVFISDEALHFGHTVVDAVKTLLSAAGIEAVTIGHQSNGFLASSLGLVEVAKQQAALLLEQLKASGARQLMVLTPGDYYTLTQLYPERLGVVLPDDVEVVDLTTLLAQHVTDGTMRLNKLETEVAYAYVDPTHAVRVPQRFDAPRTLLRALLSDEARELFWRRERAHPVSSTGLLFTQPDLAEKLTRARLEDAKQSGAHVTVTEDPATAGQLNRFSADYGIEVKGLYELLSDNLAS